MFERSNGAYEFIASHSAYVRLPVLRHPAFEIFACLASSAADEHTLSIAGNVLSGARHNTQEELAEEYQELRSWFAQDLIQAVVD